MLGSFSGKKIEPAIYFKFACLSNTAQFRKCLLFERFLIHVALNHPAKNASYAIQMLNDRH